MCGPELRVPRDCLCKILPRAQQVVLGVLIKVRHAALVEIPRVEIIRTLASRAPALDLSELRLDRADDCLRDLVLHGEYVG